MTTTDGASGTSEERLTPDLAELARLLLQDAYKLQSQPGTKEICQHLTDAAIALDVASKRAL